MKTIVRKDNQVSLYIFPDEMVVKMLEDQIVVGDPVELIITDCDINNCDLIENVEEPDDWFGWKYKHDGTSWFLNADWVDPRIVFAQRS